MTGPLFPYTPDTNYRPFVEMVGSAVLGVGLLLANRWLNDAGVGYLGAFLVGGATLYARGLYQSPTK